MGFKQIAVAVPGKKARILSFATDSNAIKQKPQKKTDRKTHNRKTKQHKGNQSVLLMKAQTSPELETGQSQTT